MPVVSYGSSQKQPKYPFCTYSLINPYLPQASYTQGNDLFEQVDITFSLTFTGDGKSEVNMFKMAQKCASLFKQISTQQYLADHNLAFVRIDAFGVRDTFLSIDVERKTGFDVRLRTTHIETSEIQDIGTIYNH